MPARLILGTAGHIDHGKTALVKALTGVDCDRLPEEKARGITIDLGFAPLQLDEFHLGVVDVPGHERFIRNMLAGAAGVDLALLVVAADDSIMPQTREHFEILKLLGLKHGVVAVTKSDLVDAETLALVELEIRELLADSFLADAPIIPTSAHTGRGIDELKSAIVSACRHVISESRIRTAAGPFRMAIDRVFVVQGHGAVVTGSVTSGSVRIGEEIAWLPADRPVRIRALHNHDQPVDEIRVGMRAAVNLAGVEHSEIHRGQELASPGFLTPTQLLTVHLRVPKTTPRPIKHRLPVRLHLGAAEVMATLLLPDREVLNPGESGFGQLQLRDLAVASWGQPFVLRESAAMLTLAGGIVVQPAPKLIRRKDSDDLGRLPELMADDRGRRAEAATWFRRYDGVTAADLVRDAGVPAADAEPVLSALRDSGRLVAAGGRLIHEQWRTVLDLKLLDVLGKLHAEHPLMTGHDRSKVEARLESVAPPVLVHETVERLLQSGRVALEAGRLARADFTPKLSANQRKLKDKIIEAHQAGGFQPPDVGEFVKQAAGTAASVRDLFDVCVAEGRLVRITPDIHLASAVENQLREKVSGRLREGRGLTVAEIRDLLGTTRKYAVPLCEYLDRIGLTRREGDLRWPGTVETATEQSSS